MEKQTGSRERPDSPGELIIGTVVRIEKKKSQYAYIFFRESIRLSEKRSVIREFIILGRTRLLHARY